MFNLNTEDIRLKYLINAELNLEGESLKIKNFYFPIHIKMFTWHFFYYVM